MKIIHRARKTGKTTDLIKMAAETGDYIVTRNHQSARDITDMAAKMGLEILFPITYTEFAERRFLGKRIKGFLIDDADEFLHYFTYNIPIDAITISGEKYEDRNHQGSSSADFGSE